jgi:hypothetical protein
MDAHRDGYGEDIYTEPDGEPDTLANLGPLAPMAGVWEGRMGIDDHPVVEGLERDEFVERYELQPIDRQTNGPQLFYGLRYHTHIVKPGEVETFHDQVGYWLWEPATATVTFTLAIPRGQVLMATGPAAPDATDFEVASEIGSDIYNGDGTWSYAQQTDLVIPDRDDVFAHVDRNTLTKVADPTPNPLAGG